ncbi:MAG TPA: outer membrane homotrimeric porin [Candidatus Desulfovibrio intestinipullorum]|uniref:Outer membrane homotrimeric porin n=1 Tax=Candidatus Desulfovibrio intestinipullorum TaxID=2838536 RepID=A0A9D1PVI0_9BACT|nr:outer membrane homotrimeric porin [Candidatus Desulfovibrio intestinipullorum]
MKRLVTLVLAAGLVFSAASGSQAIEFKVAGEWLMGFNAAQGSLVSHKRTNGTRTKADNKDIFSAGQRLRIQLDAVASEQLSGTVFFEIGDTTWGQSSTGGALGADSTEIIRLKRAYLDWAVPNTDLKVRMGLQGLPLPFVAGGSAILNDDVAAVVASYKFTENVGLTFFWARPYNDNYRTAGTGHGNDKDYYLDNMDLFSLALPLTFEGIELTPWVMYGSIGQNTFRDNDNVRRWFTMSGYENDNGRWNSTAFDRERATTSAFWAGLPVKLTLWDPLNIEFDINYGYVQSMGRGTITSRYGSERYDTRREGWLAKALIEYKMDWGTPGIFGWYSSGDDGNPGNGSERMPTVSAAGNFTSFLGDGNLAWASARELYDRNLSYSGTWGIGLQLKDMSFVEDLKHTFRAAYWGGTNSPSMAKYANSPWGWGSFVDDARYGDLEHYLTTNDGILEFNLVNVYQLYENFQINLELSYLVNFIDQGTWERSIGGTLGDTYTKQDAWKAQLIFAYTF